MSRGKMSMQWSIRWVALWLASGFVWSASAVDVRELGPAPVVDSGFFHTGRVSAVACSATDANVYYAAGADGGVWRTDDGGETWTPLTDTMPTTAMGALAVDPTNHDVIYAGTGEANYANHSRYGLGLYKSVNGGQTWAHLAEDVFAGRCFAKLLIDPTDTQVLYAAIARAGGFPELAAAKGHPGATGPVGVFRSTDGGVTWTHLTNGLPNLSATDVAMDPQDSNVIYAGIGRIFGDPDNGLYKTVNAGDTWQKLSGNGLPGGTWGRISVAVAPSDRNRVYTLITEPADASGGDAEMLGAYRSDDGGATWVDADTDSELFDLQATYGWFLSLVTVNPHDADEVYMGGVTFHRSLEAGNNWLGVTPPHVDMHAAAWDAAGRLLVGDDGGVHRSENQAQTWEPLNHGLGTIQFYAGLTTHPDIALWVLGGTQDNGTNRRISNLRWLHMFGGDGGWTQRDPVSGEIYLEYQGTGNLFRSDPTQEWLYMGSGIDPTDRNCFLPPYLIDPQNPTRMLYGTQRVYESLNAGGFWTALSADLTNGGNAAIRTLAIAPSDSNVVYAATNDSRVLRSDDGGQTFTLIADDAHGWPRTTRELFVHPTDPMTVYLAVGWFGTDQIRKSTDGGQTWQSLDANLPDVPANTVAVDVRGNLETIYLGTDNGLYRSINGGQSWHRYATGMAYAPVIDLLLEFDRERLIAATQGRGAWRIWIGVPGDLNCDLEVDYRDINYFVQALHGEPAWRAFYADNHAGAEPPCIYLNGDSDGDGRVTFSDIVPLVEVLGN